MHVATPVTLNALRPAPHDPGAGDTRNLANDFRYADKTKEVAERKPVRKPSAAPAAEDSTPCCRRTAAAERRAEEERAAHRAQEDRLRREEEAQRRDCASSRGGDRLQERRQREAPLRRGALRPRNHNGPRQDGSRTCSLLSIRERTSTTTEHTARRSILATLRITRDCRHLIAVHRRS